jgi:hypothetical protein
MEDGKSRRATIVKASQQTQQQSVQQAPPQAAQGSSQPISAHRLKYDLQIDKQVENFLDLKQKLVFFLITASAVSVGYTLNFAVTQLDKIVGHPLRMLFLVSGSVLGLLSEGAALYSLSLELTSYHMHLDIRYKRIEYEELPPERQKRWDTIKWRAETFRKAAFVLLFLSVISLAGVFVLFVV